MGWLALYALTTALELPVILTRCVAAYLGAALALRLTGHSGAAATGWMKLALAPTLWSALALVNPAGDGWWWQRRMGGREPSQREYLAYRAAIDRLQSATTLPLPRPGRWFVVDDGEYAAAVRGDALLLSKTLLESPRLAAALAHQLGHLHASDARLTAAVSRLCPHPRSLPHPHSHTRPRAHTFAGAVARTTIALLRGGLAPRLTAPAWEALWRQQEYAADRFAARIGQGEELVELLEDQAIASCRPIPHAWQGGQPQPPAELRIDALRVWAGVPTGPGAPTGPRAPTGPGAPTQQRA